MTKILEFETNLKNSPSDGADTPDGLDFWTLVICKSNFAISLEISSEKNSFKVKYILALSIKLKSLVDNFLLALLQKSYVQVKYFLIIYFNNYKVVFKITNQSVLNAGISHVVGVEQLIEAVPAANIDGKTAAHENAVPSKENCSRKFLVAAQKGPIHIWDGSGNKSEEVPNILLQF